MFWMIKLKLKTYMKKNWRIKDNWYRKYLKKLNLENQKKLIRIESTNVKIYEISEETRGKEEIINDIIEKAEKNKIEKGKEKILNYLKKPIKKNRKKINKYVRKIKYLGKRLNNYVKKN